MNPPVFDIENEQESSLLNPAQIVDGMKRHFWIPLTLTFLGLVLGYSYYKRQRPMYEATSVGQFGSEQGSILGMDTMTGQTLRDEKAINTLIQAAKSRDVLGRIVGDLALELFFERHHELDRVEAVGAEIVDERCVLRHLLGLDAQVLDDDLLDPLRDIAHRSSSFLFHFVVLGFRTTIMALTVARHVRHTRPSSVETSPTAGDTRHRIRWPFPAETQPNPPKSRGW